MKQNDYGIGVYSILTIIFFIALIFILALPQFYDLNQKEKTEQCIANMKEVKSAVEQYMRDRSEVFNGNTGDLIRTKYLKIANEECPENGIGDKYLIIVDDETLEINVICYNHKEFPGHTLDISK